MLNPDLCRDRESVRNARRWRSTMPWLCVALSVLPACQTMQDSEATLAKADESWRDGDHDEAIDSLDKAIENDKKDASLYTAKINYLLQDGRYEEGLAAIRDADERFPDNPDLYQLLGKVHRTLGNDDKAQRAYRKAIRGYSKTIRLSPWKESALIKRAETYFYLGDLSAAQRDCHQAKTITLRNDLVLSLLEDIERVRRGEDPELSDNLEREDLFTP